MDYPLVSARTLSDKTRSKVVNYVADSLSDREPNGVKCLLFDPTAFQSILFKLQFVFIIYIIQEYR